MHMNSCVLCELLGECTQTHNSSNETQDSSCMNSFAHCNSNRTMMDIMSLLLTSEH